jgi:hypothetical protein
MAKDKQPIDIDVKAAKLKALEAKRNDEYEMLGRLTYRQLKTGISQADRIAPVISNLDEIRARIRKINADIEGVKQERDNRRMRERIAAYEVEENELELDEIVEEVNSDNDDEEDDE